MNLPARSKRLGAVALCLVCGTLAFWSSLMLMSQWDDLWSGGDFYQSGSLWYAMTQYQWTVQQYADLKLGKLWGESQDYLQQLQTQQLEESLSAENTNYRYQLRTDAGTLLYSNLEEDRPFSSLAGQQTGSFTLIHGTQLQEQDVQSWNGECYLLQVWTGEEYMDLSPLNPTDVATAQTYGYTPSTDLEEHWDWTPETDSRVQTANLVLESGVTDPLTVEDLIWSARKSYDDIQRWLAPLTLVCLSTLAATLVSLVWLCRQKRLTGLSWQDRIPYDLYLVVNVFLLCVLLAAGDPISSTIVRIGYTMRLVVGLEVLSLAGAALILSTILTTVARHRHHTLWRNTLLWWLWRHLSAFLRHVGEHWPITRRTVLFFLLYLLGTWATSSASILIPFYQGAVLWGLCRWTRQWNAIRAATQAMVHGGDSVPLQTANMYPDLRQHAQQLNDLSASIALAVEERLKSERFKAELITNVSHDLKTPLTSILNYVDLLKKTEIQDPKAWEYLDVLDRKAQRLKKLTEDLVEASKASSGVLPVHLEPLDFAQLVQQAAGEYEDRFQKAGLTVVLDPPAGDCNILADGRHLWRVVDNLLGNCCKYALRDTRVYLNLTAWEGQVRLTVKNVSRAPLNVSPEQLMERFVRGDTARSSEGSGLGLSIARSLTELQGGTFQLEIDGDLFKAMVSLPSLPAEPAPVLPAGNESELEKE